MSYLRSCGGAVFALAVASTGFTAGAQDKKDTAPRITAVSPLVVKPGEPVHLRLRGVKLDEAQSIHFSTEALAGISPELKEKKKAGNLTGFEEAESGGTEAEFRFTIPAGLQLKTARFKVATSSGDTDEREVRVEDAGGAIEEKDPNEGFKQSQSIGLGQIVRGTIKEEKDVDTFRFNGEAGQQIQAEIFASLGGSLLDSVLTLFDAHGRVITSNDDQGKCRDSKVKVTLPEGGEYFVSVQDAHDRGSFWHSYELHLSTAK